MLKRIFDIVFASAILTACAPLFALIAILTKLDSNGPVFFVQDRLGLNGEVFSMFKFRTMVKDAEQTGTGLFSYSDDSRITRVGRVLRMTSLDELPQFINVVMGTMSVVGPRPPVTYELGDYQNFSDWQKMRFTVKPGLTGLAQVSGRNALTWEQKIQFDNEYVREFDRSGMRYDAVLILRTIWVVATLQSVVETRRAEDEASLTLASEDCISAPAEPADISTANGDLEGQASRRAA
ncbi:UDP-glucose:undecaprenyl-phosphate glucose-1-phosphate transferase [Rosistilla ulvae]|uniref:UDP-glucose:undecaprenyl-phosphate glucose-1-phosphate transferase n=1 Tax=Rosistilla ulvae TaxID=1930277 RepID=A0A517LWP0_9BACT|nr:sugar transferase [Rosistilla ulvae]QDS87037.1 UDP-glucose:undecaprenyl-phosphate glucose-1-phosphate transferase [Rosistilla ulvae]